MNLLRPTGVALPREAPKGVNHHSGSVRGNLVVLSALNITTELQGRGWVIEQESKGNGIFPFVEFSIKILGKALQENIVPCHHGV